MREVKTLRALVLSCGLSLAASCGSSNDSADPGTFTEIYETLFPSTTNARCNFCHSMPASDRTNGALSMGMDQTSAYEALVGKKSKSSRCGGQSLVVPNDPDRSLLLLKVSDGAPCGSRMPIGGMHLSDDQLAMIRSWIEAGAKND